MEKLGVETGVPTTEFPNVVSTGQVAAAGLPEGGRW